MKEESEKVGLNSTFKKQRSWLLVPSLHGLLGSKVTADDDCSHEHLLPGRKAMTNLDSILKSRDITLLTKAHIVKAIVFSVVMYKGESWTIKKGEC